MGTSPLVALLVLYSSTSQVTLLAALYSLASRVIALPSGMHIQHRYKRQIMIGMDLTHRAVPMLSRY